MSARAIWKGFLTVGVVTVPIKAYKATDEPGKDTSCRQLHSTCCTPINQINRCTTCNSDVAFSDVVKGFPQADGTFVLLTPEDIASIKPQSTDNIAVDAFVPVDDIDPLYVRDTYFLTPDGSGAHGPYTILQKAMESRKRAGAGRLTIHNREQSVTIAPVNGGLVLQLMRTKTEVRSAAELPGYVAPGAVHVEPVMLKMAEQLVDHYAGPFDPTDYEDAYAEDFKTLVESKKNGTPIVKSAVVTPAPATDLMTALRASLASKVPVPVKKVKAGVEQKGKSTKGKTKK